MKTTKIIPLIILSFTICIYLNSCAYKTPEKGEVEFSEATEPGKQLLIEDLNYEAQVFGDFKNINLKKKNTKSPSSKRIFWPLCLPTAEKGIFLSWRVSPSLSKATEFKIMKKNAEGIFTEIISTKGSSFLDSDGNENSQYIIQEWKGSRQLHESKIFKAEMAFTYSLQNTYKVIQKAHDPRPEGRTHNRAAKAYVGHFDDDDYLDFAVMESWFGEAYNNPKDAIQNKFAFDHFGTEPLWSSKYIIATAVHGQSQIVHDLDGDGISEIVSFEPAAQPDTNPLLNMDLVVRDGKTGKIKKITSSKTLRNRVPRLDMMVVDLDGDGKANHIVVKRVNYYNTYEETVNTPLRADEDRKYRMKLFHYASASVDQDGIYENITEDQQEVNIEGYKIGSDKAPQWMAFDSNLKLEWRVWMNGQCAHNPAYGDLDGDGRDEIVVGGNLVLDDDGTPLWMVKPQKEFPYRKEYKGRERNIEYYPGSLFWGQSDGLWVDDIDPETPGLEIISSSENDLVGIGLFDRKGTLKWFDETIYTGGYPTLAVADFVPSSPGLEIAQNVHRSSQEKSLNFFTLFSSKGKWLDAVNIDPDVGGARVVEEINWNGDQDGRDILVKARNTLYVVNVSDGKVKILFSDSFSNQGDPEVQKSHTGRAVDVIGDGREEILVVRDGSFFIYSNTDENPSAISSPWDNMEYALRKYVNHPTGL